MNACGAIILARMASARLPGKVLRELAGKPVLDHVIDRARRIRAASRLVVATSTEPGDDAVVEHAGRRGVAVFRGSHDDVAARILACAETLGLDYFARINADSPLLDPDLIDGALRRAQRERLDFVTNLHPRTYPYGVAVEVFRTAAYRAGYERMSEAADREHVSRYFYRNIDSYRCAAIRLDGRDCSHVRLAVDTADDLARIGRFIASLGAGSDRLGAR